MIAAPQLAINALTQQGSGEGLGVGGVREVQASLGCREELSGDVTFEERIEGSKGAGM